MLRPCRAAAVGPASSFPLAPSPGPSAAALAAFFTSATAAAALAATFTAATAAAAAATFTSATAATAHAAWVARATLLESDVHYRGTT